MTAHRTFGFDLLLFAAFFTGVTAASSSDISTKTLRKLATTNNYIHN